MSVLKKFIFHDIRPLRPGAVVVLKLTNNIVVAYIKTEFDKWSLFTKEEIQEIDDKSLALYMSDIEYTIITDWIRNEDG